MIRIVVPGEPVAQGRGRAFGFKRHDGSIGVRVYDPEKSRNWKAMAQDHMRQAMGERQPIAGPVQIDVVAYFTLPKSRWKKRAPVGVQVHCQRPDADNVGKIIKDSAKGVLWIDDAQVCDVRVRKFFAAQGEAPRVEIEVTELVEDQPGEIQDPLPGLFDKVGT